MSPEGSDPRPQAARTPITALGGVLIGPAFLLLGLWFLLGTPDLQLPSAGTPPVYPNQIDPSPRRRTLGDPPLVLIAGYEQNCNSCHRLFDSTWDGTRPRTQHLHIRLEHGLNNQCMNCHAREDRERLVLSDGSTVPFSDAPILCAQCHGPLYHDWTRGVHGKTLGYWDAALGARHKLSCTECHDPHHPAYDPIAPLPAPHTLRMGEPNEHHRADVEAERNPLRLWSLERPEPSGADGSHDAPDQPSNKHSHEEGAPE